MEVLESLCFYAPVLVVGLGMAWLMYVNSLNRALAVLKAFGGASSGLRYDSLTETVVGEIDGVAVRISIEPLRVGAHGSERRATQFRLRDPRASMLSLQPYRESMAAVRTGDPAFDGAVLLQGPRGEALAAMERHDRGLVAHAIDRGWVCTEGVWTYEVPRRIVKRFELTSLLKLGLDACFALRADHPTDVALAERVMSDDLLEVRQEALAALLAAGPPPRRLELRLLAQEGPVAVPVAAHLPAPRDVEQLVAFVDHEDAETSWLATQELLRRDVEAAVVRRGLVRGLDGAWCGAAIEELGRRGEVADVPALRALTEGWLSRHGGAAEAAIRAIQSRARGAGVGQLALAEARGDGALSVVKEVGEAQRAARRAADRRPEG